MKALLLLCVALWIAAGIGQVVLVRFSVLQPLRSERFVYATAIGLGIAAYGVFVLGLCGLLSLAPIAALWIGLAVIGSRGIATNTRMLVEAFSSFRTATARSSSSAGQWWSIVGVIVLVVFGTIAVLACFLPPGGFEWDAIAYHLADPKVFLLQHKITSLPTEHHSNFPLTLEMLFAVGLLFNGYALANLFHFATASLTVLVMLAFCRRTLTGATGWIAVILFVSTPVVLWEAGVAYIDLGFGLFSTLATLAAVSACRFRDEGRGRDSEESRVEEIGKREAGRGASGSKQDAGMREKAGESGEGRECREWVALAGICMGLALGTKYLALVPFGILALLLLVRLRNVRLIAVYAALALTIASPWYLKNIVVTHNPVYPYFFKLFPDSKYWSADRAALYEGEQVRFGSPHSLKQPAVAFRNLLQAPYDLVANPERYMNAGEFSVMALIGGLYAVFNTLLLLRLRLPRTVIDLALLGLLQFCAWFFIAQVSRYLISVLPLLAITGGYAVAALFERDAGFEHAASEVQAAVKRETGSGRFRVIALVPLLALGGQVVMTLWDVFVLPPRLTALSVPDAIGIVFSADGPQNYLRHFLDSYRVIEWIDRNVPAGQGVLLYDEVRGFYLDRPYLWANNEHSAFIPYDHFQTAQQMTDWMVAHNYRWALINLNHAGQAATDPRLPTGPNGHEAEALQFWYATVRPGAPHYRVLLADAIRTGLWSAVPAAQHGVVLLHLGPAESMLLQSPTDSDNSRGEP